MLSRPLKYYVPQMQSQVTNESSHHISCHFHLTKQWIQWEFLLEKKKKPWACTKTTGESILCSWCWEQSPSGRWCTHTFVQAGTHWHTGSMLPQRLTLFCIVLKSSQHTSSNNVATLDVSTIPVPIAWDAVRKGTWKMVVLELLQWCRCEEKQFLFVPVGWHGVNTFIWPFSLLFHCSSLGEFLLCDSMSSTRRHLASGLHSGQDRKSYFQS